MVNTFINPVINPDAKLGFDAFDDAPIQLWPEHSEADVEVVIRAVYRQVLGNAHVMESERLTTLESQLRQGDISVREFVRGVAKSGLYRSRFFENSPRYRAIELNFKHLLGRAPESYDEMTHHSHRLDDGGYDAEIDSYLDSDEYSQAFGDDIVPYYRGHKTQTGKRMVGFAHLLTLFRGASSSDNAVGSGVRSRLGIPIMTDTPKPVVVPSGLSPTWNPPTDTNALLSQVLGLKQQPIVPSAPRQTPMSKEGGATQTTASERQKQYQGYQAFENAPVELCPGASDAECEIVIRAIYRQVLGNAYVMESERLTVPESQLKRGEISVREFVRWVAKSELYQSRFVDTCYRYRSIELNFKHLLGRAPDNFDEMKYHSAVLDQEGFEADIDTYLDSDEYQQVFGEMIVPYYRGYKTQPGQSMLGFTNMLQLLRSASSSDKDLVSNKPRLARSLIINRPFGIEHVRDVQDILAEVFQPTALRMAVTAASSTRGSEAEQALHRQQQEQQDVIEQLQTQLKELRSVANIGASVIRQGQFSTPEPDQGKPSLNRQSFNTSPLAQQVEEQSALIADLQRQIAEARSLSAIGEFRLNRWRQRSF